MKKQYTFITSPTENGEVSEVFYNEENAETPFADNLQSNCREVADKLQTNCNHLADDLQPSCNDFADKMQPTCNQPATPNRSFRRPSGLNVTDEIEEILKYLNDNKYIAEVSRGLHKNIDSVLVGQKGLPIYIVEDLQNKGMKIDDTRCRREILPLLRVQQKETVIKKLKKINLMLFVSLIITLTIFLTKSPTYPTAQATNENKAIITDSVCTADELHKYITEYTKLTKTKIYPYSENIILHRVNQKGLTSINEIKNEIETRLAELAKR